MGIYKRKLVGQKKKQDEYEINGDKYAIKMLRNTTLRRKKQYANDANDDIMQELHILSSTLKGHKNIISVYGFGIARNNNGKSFLIIDQLNCTLWDKLHEWKYSRNQVDGNDQDNKKRDKELFNYNDTSCSSSLLEE